MSVLKRSTVCYGGGVDISNTVEPRRQPAPVSPAGEQPQPDENAEKELALRAARLLQREQQLAAQERELAALKEQYIEQGKEVILEAKRRADAILQSAQENAAQVVAEAEKSRDDIFIKARAEGFELGQKEGVDACLAAGQDVLDEARAFAQSINEQKQALFEQYESELFDTVMAIANKVTLDSMSVKDGTAAKKLIKKAAKEFRNSDVVRITLDKNGATEELAADYEYLKELCSGAAHVEIELLPDADPGTVIVDNGSEITDAGIQTQLRMIQELGNSELKGLGRKKKKPKAAEE